MNTSYYITVGIDPSINSTGVCVYSFTNGKSETKDYFCIGTKPTKATLGFYSDNSIEFVDYGKTATESMSYAEKELVKTRNILNSAYSLRNILESTSEKYGGIDCVVMEGVSYGSVSGSSLVDLAGLNFVYRENILEVCSNLIIASPMEIKKFAVGNGGVDKDIMISVWTKCENIDFPDGCRAKVDDIADSYFMALYGMCSCCKEFEESIEMPKIEIPKKENKKSKKTDQADEEAKSVFVEMSMSSEQLF